MLAIVATLFPHLTVIGGGELLRQKVPRGKNISHCIFLHDVIILGDRVAEWSKALVSGTSLQWREFESRLCQPFFVS